MIIYYDGYCSICQRSSSLWQKLDWRHKLIFTSFRTLDNYPAAMEKELYIYHNGKWFSGFNAIIQISKMLPLLWITIPILYAFQWFGFGEVLYKKIAKNRKIVPVNQCQEDACMIYPSQDEPPSLDE